MRCRILFYCSGSRRRGRRRRRRLHCDPDLCIVPGHRSEAEEAVRAPNQMMESTQVVSWLMTSSGLARCEAATTVGHAEVQRTEQLVGRDSAVPSHWIRPCRGHAKTKHAPRFPHALHNAREDFINVYL